MYNVYSLRGVATASQKNRCYAVRAYSYREYLIMFTIYIVDTIDKYGQI